MMETVGNENSEIAKEVQTPNFTWLKIFITCSLVFAKRDTRR
jgi:hypothetical protein